MAPMLLSWPASNLLFTDAKFFIKLLRHTEFTLVESLYCLDDLKNLLFCTGLNHILEPPRLNVLEKH
jgi:hypothetical protein